MHHKVYKALDKPSSLFGLQGSYLLYAAGGVVAAAVVAAMVAAISNGLVGMISFILLMAVVYAAILKIQSRFSERERTKWFCSKNLPDYILVPPTSFRKYIKTDFSIRKPASTKKSSKNENGIQDGHGR